MTLRSNGSYIGYNQTDTSSSATGVWSLDEAYRRKASSNWPVFFTATGTVTITEDATPTLINLSGQRTSTNNTGADYFITQINFTPSSTGSKTLYVGYRIPSNTGISTFYHDYTIAAVQLQDSSNTILETYHNTTWTGFQTTTNKTTVALTNVPTTNSYSNVATGTSANRFNIDSSGTGSSQTGMASGIDIPSGVVVATSGGGTFPQTSSRSYLYVETSGAQSGGRFWLRKTFNTSLTSGTAYEIYLVHYLNTTNSYTTDASAFENVGALYIT